MDTFPLLDNYLKSQRQWRDEAQHPQARQMAEDNLVLGEQVQRRLQWLDLLIEQQVEGGVRPTLRRMFSMQIKEIGEHLQLLGRVQAEVGGLFVQAQRLAEQSRQEQSVLPTRGKRFQRTDYRAHEALLATQAAQIEALTQLPTRLLQVQQARQDIHRALLDLQQIIEDFITRRTDLARRVA